MEKISLYNLADLKNTSDDVIINYLNSLRFTQSYRLQDVRLGLGYSAFALSAVCFLWDYKLGWDMTKHWTAAAVAVYMILNGALTYWMTQKEKNIIYQGTAPSGEEITISTSTKKNIPIYNLSIAVRPKHRTRDTKSETYTLAREFAGWFNEAGYFVTQPFQEMLASTVPCIGKQDPNRVKAAADVSEMLKADPNLLDQVLAAKSSSAEAETTATTSTGKKGRGAAKQRKA